MVRRRLAALMGAFLVLIWVSPPASPSEPWAAEKIGRWSNRFDLPVVGIHSILLKTGEVMLFGHPFNSGRSEVVLWDPESNRFRDVSIRRDRDLFCSGHTLLADGRVLFVGGERFKASTGHGAKGTDLFDPRTRTWTAGPQLDNGRWYPTTIELPDGKVLVFSGQHLPDPDGNNDTIVDTVDSFDPKTAKLTTLPGTADKSLELYPRLHLLPSGLIFHAGPEGQSHLFDPATNQWSDSDAMTVDRRMLGTSVLLPGLDRVLALGGRTEDGPTASAEIIDFDDPAPEWTPTASMAHSRLYANAVLLPDGKVLVVGGGEGPRYTKPVPWSEQFDPESETWQTMAPQSAPLTHHSTALLLPDGRVLSAGQDRGPNEFTAETYSPPYLFAGARPSITKAPRRFDYAQTYEVSTSEAESIERVALVRPGSVTHSVNFEQRFVDLDFAPASATKLEVGSPSDARQAPPGWYMLFITNDEGVPSVADWVHVKDG